MTVNIDDQGRGNRINADADVLAGGVGTIVLTGDDNEITIGPGCKLIYAQILMGANCRLDVAPNCRLAQLQVFAARDSAISIGEATNFTAHTRLFLHEPGNISIGGGCMIASQTLFTVSDMHSLLDAETGQRINQAADIVIGNKVWIGAEVTVLKGVTIGDGSAIGLRAVVTRDIPPNCLAVGMPARVIRENVAWSPDLL